MNLLAVFLGGGLGALSRYGVAIGARRLWPAAAMPWGTLIVNVAGCFLLGFLANAFASRQVPEALRLGATTGFLGGLTTFSTFGHETMVLFGGQGSAGLLNVVANVGLGLLAAAAGMYLGARL